MTDFNGKVAVVTGAASGIGKGLVESFLKEGMKVVLSDIDEKSLMEVAGIYKKSGADLLAVTADVSQIGDFEILAEKTMEKYNNVHILCNNAGIGFGNGLTWENSIDDWNWVLGVNLMGAVHGIKTFVPIMENRGIESHIINTSSTAGVFCGSGSSPYAVSKHAVLALSECLYNDLIQRESKISVSVLCPGFVKSNILDPLRSRPDRFESFKAVELPPQLEMIGKAFKYAVDTGMEPDVIGEKVLKGIINKQFYIFTHENTKEQIKNRMDNMLFDKNPQAELPGEFIEYFKTIQ